MNHHLGYHNPETMGYEWGGKQESGGVFAFYTSREVGRIEGDVLWVVTSDKAGRSKTYYLCGWYIVKAVCWAEDAAFKYTVEGTEGHCLGPWLNLNFQTWFPGFRKRQGNFGLGVNAIHPQDVRELTELLRSNRERIPS